MGARLAQRHGGTILCCTLGCIRARTAWQDCIEPQDDMATLTKVKAWCCAAAGGAGGEEQGSAAGSAAGSASEDEDDAASVKSEGDAAAVAREAAAAAEGGGSSPAPARRKRAVSRHARFADIQGDSSDDDGSRTKGAAAGGGAAAMRAVGRSPPRRSLTPMHRPRPAGVKPAQPLTGVLKKSSSWGADPMAQPIPAYVSDADESGSEGRGGGGSSSGSGSDGEGGAAAPSRGPGLLRRAGSGGVAGIGGGLGSFSTRGIGRGGFGKLADQLERTPTDSTVPSDILDAAERESDLSMGSATGTPSTGPSLRSMRSFRSMSISQVGRQIRAVCTTLIMLMLN